MYRAGWQLGNWREVKDYLGVVGTATDYYISFNVKLNYRKETTRNKVWNGKDKGGNNNNKREGESNDGGRKVSDR